MKNLIVLFVLLMLATSVLAQGPGGAPSAAKRRLATNDILLRQGDTIRVIDSTKVDTTILIYWNGSLWYATNAVFTGDTIASWADIYVNQNGPDGDASLYFYEGSSTTGRSLKWDNTANNFELNDALDLNGLLDVQNGILVYNGATSGGYLRLYEDTDDGGNYTGFIAQAMAGDYLYTLPADDGDASEVLTTDGSGNLTWGVGGGGGGADVDSIVGLAVQDTLNNIADNYILKFDAATDSLFWEADIAAGAGTYLPLTPTVDDSLKDDLNMSGHDIAGVANIYANEIKSISGSALEIEPSGAADDLTLKAGTTGDIEIWEAGSLRWTFATATLVGQSGVISGATWNGATVGETYGGTGDSDLDDIVGGTAITVTDGANTVIAGNATVAVTAQSITKTQIDTTGSNFIFDDAYKVTSAESDSLLATEYFAKEKAGDTATILRAELGPFIDTTSLDTIETAHKAVLADLATTATVSDDESTDDDQEIVFTTDNAALESDGDAHYNPSTGTLTSPILSSSGGTSGTLTLSGATDGDEFAITVPDNFTAPTEWILPGGDGTANYQLTTDGAGSLSWAAASGAGADLADVLGVDPDGADIDQTSLGRLEFYDVGLYLDADADAVMVLNSDGTMNVSAGTTLELHSADWDIGITGIITNTAINANDNAITNLGDGAVNNDITIDLATLATTVTVTDDEVTNDNQEIVFTTDNANLESDGTFHYNPSAGKVTVPEVNADTLRANNIFISGDSIIDFAGSNLSVTNGVLNAVAVSVAYDNIGNPDANGSIAMGAYTGTYTSATDGWGGLIVSNTVADMTSADWLLTLAYTDDGDADADFLRCLDNSSTDIKFSISEDGSVATTGTVDTVDIANLGAEVQLSTAHVADNTQAHTDYLLNSGSDVFAGNLSGDGVVADSAAIDTLWASRVNIDSLTVVGNIVTTGLIDTVDVANLGKEVEDLCNDSASWNDHVADNTQAHTDYLLNSGSDAFAGNLSGDGVIADSAAIDSVVVANSLTIPQAENPTTGALARIAQDADAGAFEAYDTVGTDHSVLIPFSKTMNFPIWNPDLITDTICFFYVDSLIYPGGIEIVDASIQMSADAGAGTYLFELMYFTAADPPVLSDFIDTLVVANGDSRKHSRTFENSTIAVGQQLAFLTHDDDIDWIRVSITYYVKEND